MNRLVTFLKQWTLLISMTTGAIGYLLFHFSPSLDVLKPSVIAFAENAIPTLLFLTLFLTFCKVEPKAILQIKRWHIWLLLIQTLGAAFITLYICLFSPNHLRTFFLGLLVITICPNAAAAAVVTGKLGGSESSVTTYTLLSNLSASIVIPLLFPLVGAEGQGSFLMQSLAIIAKVFPMLILPLLIAWVLRYFLPRVHTFILQKFKGVAFYLWAFNLVVLIAQCIRTGVNGEGNFLHKMLPILAGLICCIIFFPLGKYMGKPEGENISSGQGLGQKNTVFAIWITMIYLNPIVVLAPAGYVVWQNLFNSWQIHRYLSRIDDKKNRICHE